MAPKGAAGVRMSERRARSIDEFKVGDRVAARRDAVADLELVDRARPTFAHSNPGGTLRCHSVAAWKRLPSSSSSGSSNARPTTWKPSGKPLASNPQGNANAGRPA